MPTSEERLRTLAANYVNRPQAASACEDGADAIKLLCVWFAREITAEEFDMRVAQLLARTWRA